MFEMNANSISLMMYREAGIHADLPVALLESADESVPAGPGVSECEAAERVAIAVQRVRAEERTRFDEELVRKESACADRVSKALLQFTEERVRYFERVESEIVQLALSVARKILEREAHVDPSLLGALVRIALDRMQSGSAVRIRVAPSEAGHWREMGQGDGSATAWEVVQDPTLLRGDCVVETQLGSANFGFDSQLGGVEQIFTQLLAKRPVT